MKVVGGPHDGLSVFVSPVVGVIQLMNPLDHKQAIECLCGECGRVVMAPSSFTTYTVRHIFSDELGDDTIDFLAPENWSDMAALRHQFSK